MRRKLFILILGGILLIGLNACSTILPGKVVYPSDLQKKIEEVGAKATILVTEEGQVLIYGADGKALDDKACRFPKPKDKTKSRTQDAVKICPAFDAGSQVKSFSDISIFKSNSEHCITLGPDSYGTSYAVCW